MNNFDALKRSPMVNWSWSRQKRVPVLRQLNAVECGSASLAMVLGYYGHHVTVAECSQLCGVGRDGLTVKTIIQTARSLGLVAKAYHVPNLAVLAQVALPAIAYWQGNHFVVVERITSRVVELVDPAVGRRRLSPSEFLNDFTQVIIALEPGAGFEVRQGQPSGWIVQLQMLLRIPGTRALLAKVLLVSLILQLQGLVLPLLTQRVVDGIVPAGTIQPLNIFGLGLLLFALFQLANNYSRATLFIRLQKHLDTQLMAEFFKHILSLPFSFFQQRSSGDLIARLGSNTIIREILTGQTLSALLDGLFIIGYLIIIWTQDSFFAALALGLGTIQLGVLWATHSRLYSLTQRDLASQAEFQSYMVEALTGIATLKAGGAEEHAYQRWSRLFNNHMDILIKRTRLSAQVDAVLTTLLSFSPLLLLWVGAMRVIAGDMSLGMMLALSALTGAFLAPLSSLATSGRQLQLVGAHLERVVDVMETEPESSVVMTDVPARLSGAVAVRDLSFRYSPHAPFVLRGVNVSIRPGEKVAIIGRTGSGKTTLGLLLLGLHQPTSGTIRYDNTPLEQYDLQWLRRQFGVVMQEPFLFDGSLHENIAFNNPDIYLNQIRDAAKQAHIHDDIQQLPMGYETRVAEGGAGFSGGQRQRLTLARALVNTPSILLLDEATSHLDEETERLVEANLNKLGCTRIVIAHRLSTVRNADKILVLENGTITAQGSHAELLATHVYYTSLVEQLD